MDGKRMELCKNGELQFVVQRQKTARKGLRTLDAGMNYLRANGKEAGR